MTRLAAQKARKVNTKVYYTAHGFHFFKGAPILNWLIYYPIEKLFARRTDKLITIVSEDYQLAMKKFKCPVYRIHGVGADENRFHPINYEEKVKLKKKLGFESNQKIILCVGELLSNKNQQMIINSMPEIIDQNPNAMLLLAGNGPNRAKLESLVDSLNLHKNVRMLGYVTNIQDYHKVCDLLVSCSIREGLGMNVIESMMVGNPVVITDNRGHRELIDNGKNGYIVSVNDIKRMIDDVCKLLYSEDDYEMYSNNAKLFSKRYSAKSIKKELKDIYEL